MPGQPGAHAQPGVHAQPGAHAQPGVPAAPGVHGPYRAVYVISVAAELAGVHPQTLRIYERKGLVDPSRTGGGSRRYSQRDIDRLRHIQDLTGAGLNLEGVRRVLELEADNEQLHREIEQLRGAIEEVRAEAREALERTHRQYRRDLVPLRQATVVWRPPRSQRPRR
ncbi:MAG: helix-turn-helix transcriptional regulator [Actinomycetota bacterium]|nr:helix-turn-helix transcriptional regulator [Actinomycetota bacterium]